MVVVCISLIISDVECLFVCLLAELAIYLQNELILPFFFFLSELHFYLYP